MRLELLPRHIAHQRSALGHAVAGQVGEMDVHEAFLYFGINCRTSRDKDAYVATQCVHQSFADTLFYERSDARDMP